jgi:hypothetical protein
MAGIVEARGPSALNPLFQADTLGEIERVKLLISKSADDNERSVVAVAVLRAVLAPDLLLVALQPNGRIKEPDALDEKK